MANSYSFVIAGGGAAGLSLAWHLGNSPLRDEPILIVERTTKTTNDRTWCFWEVGEGPLEKIVHRQWAEMAFMSPAWSSQLNLAPYRYKMIRGLDFYRFMEAELASRPHVVRLQGEVEAVDESDTEAWVQVAGRRYAGKWLFNSIPGKEPAQPGYHHLLQHFKGWEVQTLTPQFDPGRATLMDFRIPQHDQCRFFYVLPLDSHRALVEFTLFSPELLPAPDYDKALQDYLRDKLSITDYQVVHEEFGVIPMTDQPFARRPGRRIVNLGTAGGQTKPSTGYTFRRVQQHSQALVRALLETGKPVVTLPATKARFRLYDQLFLDVLARNRYPAPDLFANLFRQHAPATVLRFLDEDTHFGQELKIMAASPQKAFLTALAAKLRR